MSRTISNDYNNDDENDNENGDDKDYMCDTEYVTDIDIKTDHTEIDDSDEESEILSELRTLSDNPDIDDALIQKLTYDLAVGLHSAQAIARRYGMTGVDSLKQYLMAHPYVVKDAQNLRAAFMSDASTEERVRMKFLKATERLIVPLANIAHSPRTPLNARIDAFKQIQRGAGLDGMGSASRGTNSQRDGGHPFNLIINFSGTQPFKLEAEDIHSSATAPLQITEATTVVEDDEPNAIDDEI